MSQNNNDAALGDRMPFTQHLEELRKRLIVCFAAVGVGFLVSYLFKEQILLWLMQPLMQVLPEGSSRRLIYTAPHEAFVTYLKVSFIAGTGLAVPVILYQLWKFVAPGLYQHEKQYLLPVVFFSSLFFLGGAIFGYFVVFPYGFQFFVSFANQYIAPMISTKEFTSFSTRLLLAFGAIFEMPVVAFVLARLGLISAGFLRRQRKYAVLIIFIVAAILTPPDVLSQLLMALPLLVLYEMSIWIVHFAARKANAGEELEEKPAGPAG
jgi:sec-independent protein translocase protein TatC